MEQRAKIKLTKSPGKLLAKEVVWNLQNVISAGFVGTFLISHEEFHELKQSISSQQSAQHAELLTKEFVNNSVWESLRSDDEVAREHELHKLKQDASLARKRQRDMEVREKEHQEEARCLLMEQNLGVADTLLCEMISWEPSLLLSLADIPLVELELSTADEESIKTLFERFSIIKSILQAGAICDRRCAVKVAELTDAMKELCSQIKLVPWATDFLDSFELDVNPDILQIVPSVLGIADSSSRNRTRGPKPGDAQKSKKSNDFSEMKGGYPVLLQQTRTRKRSFYNSGSQLTDIINERAESRESFDEEKLRLRPNKVKVFSTNDFEISAAIGNSDIIPDLDRQIKEGVNHIAELCQKKLQILNNENDGAELKAFPKSSSVFLIADPSAHFCDEHYKFGKCTDFTAEILQQIHLASSHDERMYTLRPQSPKH